MCNVIDFDIEELIFSIKYSENYCISVKILLTYLKSLDICLEYSLDRASRLMSFLSKEPSSYGLSIDKFAELALPHTSEFHQNRALLFKHLKQLNVQVPIHLEITRFFTEFWQLQIRLFEQFEKGIEDFFNLNPNVFKALFREIAGEKQRIFDFQKLWTFFIRNDLKLEEKQFKLFARIIQTLAEGDNYVFQENFCRTFNSKNINKIEGGSVFCQNPLVLVDPQIDLLRLRTTKTQFFKEFTRKNMFSYYKEPFLSKTKKNSNEKKDELEKRALNAFIGKCDKFLLKNKKTNIQI